MPENESWLDVGFLTSPLAPPSLFCERRGSDVEAPKMKNANAVKKGRYDRCDVLLSLCDVVSPS